MIRCEFENLENAVGYRTGLFDVRSGLLFENLERFVGYKIERNVA